jgi:hypothetical protein
LLPSATQNAASLSGVQPQMLAVPPPPHVCGRVHAPHDATVRGALQLSVLVRLPQAAPLRVQNVASLSAVQPHTLAVPPPPHVAGDVQPAPKLQSATLRDAPQLSLPATVPQFLPLAVQKAASVCGVQPHTFGVLRPHVHPVAHAPHPTVREPPQLSFAVTLPQFLPCAVQKAGSPWYVQPHTFAVTRPQVHPVAQEPQPTVRDAPQLSLAVTLPQFLPCAVQKAGSPWYVQPHTFGTEGVPPPQV